jgi:diguanylate cyclase (GGDEF)-like protein
MSGGIQAFDEQAVSGRSRLDQVATLLTSPAMCPDAEEMLVIAVRPDLHNRRVIASAGYSAVRASISVSIAAGNQRAWATAQGDSIVDVPVASLPEIIRAAIQPSGVQKICVAAVEANGARDVLVMWLTRSVSFSAEAIARHATVLQNLSDAAARDRADALAQALVEQQARAAQQAAEPQEREHSEQSGGDLLATMPTRREFDDALAHVSSDETGLVVVGIDNIDAITVERGSEAADAVRRAVAARISASIRRNDVVALIGENAFAVLLVDFDGRAAFEISKRLRADSSESVEVDGRAVEVSISVGLSHEVGLVDAVELFASAESAMADAQGAGGARMLVAC